jgi:glucan phosphoethanolaminetransferase (alkaline phosphatase superfamily)
LIDGQLSDSNKSQNFIGANERALIDDYIAADIGLPTDVRIAQQLTKRLRTPQQELIVIIKRGNHFPYAANIPPEDRQSDRTLKESYRSLVEFTTRNFFDLLWAEHKQLQDVLLFFTSDHGQYHGPGSPHCREDKLDDEYEVPIVVMGGASTYLDRLAAARECWVGGAHHQAMRSTVIEALGYSADDIASHLYPPLTVCTAYQSIPRYLGYTPFPTSTNEVLEFTLVPFRK